MTLVSAAIISFDLVIISGLISISRASLSMKQAYKCFNNDTIVDLFSAIPNTLATSVKWLTSIPFYISMNI